MASCVACGKRARRSCPLMLEQPLCAECCRKTIAGEGKCPEDCTYLQSHRVFEQERAQRLVARRMKVEPELVNLSERLVGLFVELEKRIQELSEQRLVATDADLLEAVAALEEGSRLEAMGLYSPDRILRGGTLAVYKHLDKFLLDREGGKLKGIELEGRKELFSRFSNSVKRHQQSSGTGYLDFIRGFY